MIHRGHTFFFFALLLLLCACNPLRKFSPGQQLLVRNAVHSGDEKLNKELEQLARQKPNRKIFWAWRFHLGVYSFFDRGKERGWKEKMKTVVGEAPVILDSSLTKKSLQQMQLFLFNKGFFNARVTDSLEIPGRRKKRLVNAHYYVHLGNPYTIRHVFYAGDEPKINSIVNADSASSLIRPGIQYDAALFQQERDRFTTELKNRGYFYFTKEYISFRIDSAPGAGQLDVYMDVKSIELPAGDDSVTLVPHRDFYIGKVFIQTDYNPKEVKDTLPTDTLVQDNYVFLWSGRLQYKPTVLLGCIFIKPGEHYMHRLYENSYARLADLNTFRFVNIRFRETRAGQDSLTCYVQLTPSPKQSFSIETEGTHNGGNLGIAGNFVYRNKNMFRGAELLELKMKGALEAQKTLVKNAETPNEKILLFNTLELGPEGSVVFPKFLVPFRIRNLSKYTNPKTTVTSSYNYQRRPDYTRIISLFSWGYTWKETEYKRHFIYPIEVNAVRVSLDSAFANRLYAIGAPSLIYSYEPHLITSTRYSFVFNNQKAGPQRNFFFFRGNVEFAGNILRQLNGIVKTPRDADGNYTMFGVQYSQYTKPDIDFRFYQMFSARQSLAYRVAAGIGMSYGNGKALPFERSFFGGGSNGIRAWRARSLGPGAYKNPYYIEQTGDIKIEANIEYRFGIVGKFEGALFSDVGNIWTYNKDDNRPGAKLELDKFMDEIAIGTGLGLRLNFNYFILRVDMGLRVKDPQFTGTERWTIRHFGDKKWGSAYLNQTGHSYPFSNFNLGIGYPF